ncbi:MAG: MFS transporter [Bacteroidales bacterium]
MILTKQKKYFFSSIGVFIWLIAAFFFMYEFFLRTFVGSLAEQIIDDLKLNVESFPFLGTAYYLAYGLMQIPVGLLIDKYGVKFVMLISAIMCAVATIVFSFSTSFFTAMVGRFLMGIGSSSAFVSLLVIAITWFSRKNFGLFAGLSQFMGTLGPILAGGPLVEFVLSQNISWRLALVEIGIIGFALALFILFFVKNKPRSGENNLIHLHFKETLKEKFLRLFKFRQPWFIAIYSSCNYMPLALMGAVWGTRYLQIRGLPQMSAADVISIAWIGYAIGCPLIGFLSDYFKRRKFFLFVSSSIGFIVSVIFLYASIKVQWVYYLCFFLLGIAASGQNIGFATIAEHVKPKTRAAILGLNNAVITLFISIMPPIVGYLIAVSGDGLKDYKVNDFVFGLSVIPLFYLVSVIFAIFFIRETYCKAQKENILLNPK